MKKKLALLLAAAMVVSALAGCGSKPAASSSSSGTGSISSPGGASSSVDGSTGDTSTSGSYELPDFMVMSGPTGVGAAKLMADADAFDPTNADTHRANVVASSTVVADNEAVKNALINGDADIAAVATNMAATLSAKTDGAIQVLAVNTLGVLYILEKGDTVQSMADLKGKTLYAPSTAKGANPEYILNYLLTENGVDPSEVDIQWLTPQEITAQIASSESGICMLPVPAATALLMKDSGVREALSLTTEWEALGSGALAQGCIVARTDYIEANPLGVENFLAAYQDSIAYMTDEANRADAAALVAQYEITANEQIASKAIPQCNLVCITGVEMQNILEQFYQVLYQADPASIGGAMPYDSFYYGVE